MPEDGSVRAIVTPYSCVMAQADPNTAIDLLLVHRATKNPVLFFGRSLRKLNLVASGGDAEHYFDATPADRRIIQAQQLTPYARDCSLQLVPDHRDGLSYWLAQRFLRNALPDDFNEAWRPAQRRLRDLAKEMAACRIILLLQDRTATDAYAVQLVLVVDPRASAQLPHVQQIAQQIEQRLVACPRIDSACVEAKLADAVSLQDYMEWHHFDAFDDLSMAPAHTGPANHSRGSTDDVGTTVPLLTRLRWAWGILRGPARK
ncbi:MAG: hypothetical protein KDJ33_14435 [Gammaproteobacteria bacterium]|nr:hypothetical protein [Gammaproteobacteria bacterium]